METMNRKTIESKIRIAVPNNHENLMDCGLPFNEKELARQIDELAGNIYTAVVGFAESMAVVAYGGKK